jgi:hypothetical protein
VRGAAFTAGVVLLLVGHARGQGLTFTAGLGDAGYWGVPYGWLGPQGARVWEEYRKAADTCVPPYGSVQVTDPRGPVLYDQVRQGNCDAGTGTFHAPGIFLGPNPDSRTPPGATFEIVPVTFPTSVANPVFDFRCGFLARHGSGASPAAFVNAGGGDNGAGMDLFFGNWGVDGLYLHMLFTAVGPTWSVLEAHSATDVFDADLVSGASALDEVGRTNWVSQVTTSMPFNDAGAIALSTPTSQPLSVRCGIGSADGGVAFTVTVGVGPDLTLSWLLDDGATRHDLFTPGNPDGVQYGGTLDPSSMVPILFMGAGYEGTLQPMPDLTLQLDISGQVPNLEQLSSTPQADVPSSLVVVARDANGRLVPAYAQTVRFESSDPTAALPAAYAFTPADQGSHAFQVTFATPGLQTITVIDAETPAIATTQRNIQVGLSPATRYKVGCDCGAGAPGPLGLAACLALLRRRRRS